MNSKGKRDSRNKVAMGILPGHKRRESLRVDFPEKLATASFPDTNLAILIGGKA